MNALKHSSQPSPTVEQPKRRVVLRPRVRKRWQAHQVAAAEVGVKVAVNCVLALVAGVTLIRLVPYNLAQHDKLQELEGEVATLDSRVKLLQADFNRQFDPQQAKSVMQEQSARVDPQQRRVMWLRPTAPTLDSGVPSTSTHP
ncbi:hypothetical protein IQ268_04095 [Oculatella sp. LEGE 06141]|uniref:slr1601 family putative cell division protein n=1 Tax=Oculatella sp. LEGE 06141 TaxID=1828648 RepID=UPI00188143F2|nr:hypothetical protein [Oculatella sp. LEGE 06141]MBE9177761.1 hypothetical protein [Oculatella sp. LEGE 06141]